MAHSRRRHRELSARARRLPLGRSTVPPRREFPPVTSSPAARCACARCRRDESNEPIQTLAATIGRSPPAPSIYRPPAAADPKDTRTLEDTHYFQGCAGRCYTFTWNLWGLLGWLQDPGFCLRRAKARDRTPTLVFARCSLGARWCFLVFIGVHWCSIGARWCSWCLV